METVRHCCKITWLLCFSLCQLQEGREQSSPFSVRANVNPATATATADSICPCLGKSFVSILLSQNKVCVLFQDMWYVKRYSIFLIRKEIQKVIFLNAKLPCYQPLNGCLHNYKINKEVVLKIPENRFMLN